MPFRLVVSLVVAFVVGLSSFAHAQTPQQQPLVQAGNFAYLGKFTLPLVDTAGTPLTYGGGALGMAADNTSLYYGCIYNGSVVRVKIPTLGGVATVLDPCRGPANLYQINVADGNAKLLGGSLVWNGRVILSGYSYYDAGHTATSSHFAGATPGSVAGPFRVGTDRPGMVGGYMATIPAEWRSLLGGPALTGQCCISIISRSSFGPSASVFNPDDIGTVSPIPSKMLVGYPNEHQDLGGYYGVTQYYSAGTNMGGIAFPAGTRSVLFVGRYATTFCYGIGTDDPSLHGKPTGGSIYCYDPASPYHGVHGYPYKHMVWAYDANDLLAVKQGAKQPWDLRPYATWILNDMNTNGRAEIRSVTFDPATRRLYVAADGNGNTPVVHVYEVTNAVIQPPGGGTEVCGDGIDNDNDGLIDEGCPTGQPEICGDGIDNDGDGQIDEGCPGEGTVEVCGDGIDNDRDGQVDEDCETEESVPGAPQRLYGSVKRSSVSFKWYPPLTGGTVVDYVLEAGVSPGTTFFAGSVGNSTFITVPDVGTGRYYVRVRARNGNGQSAPSNEVVVSVGCRWRPSRLSGLTATSKEGLVSLRWTDPDGCSGTKYNVTVGSVSGALQTLQTEENTATTLLPKGNYLARVVAEAETGTSDPSDLSFTVNGSTCVAPAFRTTLRLVVSGRRIGLFWSPLDPDTAKRDDAVAPVSYVLEAGTVAGGSDIGGLPMARATQLVTDVPPGVYYARVRPTNACGGGVASNEVKIVVR
jgi:hypothetical protein